MHLLGILAGEMGWPYVHPMLIFSGTAPISGSPSPPSSNTSLFSNFEIGDKLYFLSFCHQLTICFIFAHVV
jgi:hypothetical protein